MDWRSILQACSPAVLTPLHAPDRKRAACGLVGPGAVWLLASSSLHNKATVLTARGWSLLDKLLPTAAVWPIRHVRTQRSFLPAALGDNTHTQPHAATADLVVQSRCSIIHCISLLFPGPGPPFHRPPDVWPRCHPTIKPADYRIEPWDHLRHPHTSQVPRTPYFAHPRPTCCRQPQPSMLLGAAALLRRQRQTLQMAEKANRTLAIVSKSALVHRCGH